MKHKNILFETPGKTVYQAHTTGHAYHCFTDTHSIPEIEETLHIPGKGVCAHRISSFLMSRLSAVGIPTHFVKVVNMRESLMRICEPMPFDVRIRHQSDPLFEKILDIPEKTTFQPFLLEYIHHKQGIFLNEDVMHAMDWVDAEEWDDLYDILSKSFYVLQGIFSAFGCALVHATFSLGRHPDEGHIMITGHMEPQTLCLYHHQEKTYWGAHIMHNEPQKTGMHYKKIAHILGLIDSPYTHLHHQTHVNLSIVQ